MSDGLGLDRTTSLEAARGQVHCSNLVFGNTFESGERDYLAQNAVTSPVAANAIYSASVANPMIGAWRGVVYVVVDRKSFSGGELAAARFPG